MRVNSFGNNEMKSDNWRRKQWKWMNRNLVIRHKWEHFISVVRLIFFSCLERWVHLNAHSACKRNISSRRRHLSLIVLIPVNHNLYRMWPFYYPFKLIYFDSYGLQSNQIKEKFKWKCSKFKLRLVLICYKDNKLKRKWNKKLIKILNVYVRWHSTNNGNTFLWIVS